MMNQREKDALDRHITGNYGRDQFREEDPEDAFNFADCFGFDPEEEEAS